MMPSTLSVALAGNAVLLVALPGNLFAQSPGAGAELGFGVRLGIRFVVAFVLNLLVGGALVGLGPRYVTIQVNRIQNDSRPAFL